MMAKKDGTKEEKHEGGSAKGMIVGLAIASLLAAGAGAGMGLQFGSLLMPHEKKEKKQEEKRVARKYSGHGVVRKLSPIVTNLSEPSSAWVRLEAVVVFDGEEDGGLDELAALVTQDTLAYLRTLGLKDLEGGSGLAFLRDDLNERATVRSDGRVRELVILSLVVE